MMEQTTDTSIVKVKPIIQLRAEKGKYKKHGWSGKDKGKK